MRGKLLLERTPDDIQHGIRPKQYIVIPEPQDAISSSLKPARTLQIVLDLLKVLPTVQLNDQSTLETTEINNKTFNTMLPTKPITKLATTKAIPQPDLGISGVLAKRLDVIHKNPLGKHPIRFLLWRPRLKGRLTAKHVSPLSTRASPTKLPAPPRPKPQHPTPAPYPASTPPLRRQPQSWSSWKPSRPPLHPMLPGALSLPRG